MLALMQRDFGTACPDWWESGRIFGVRAATYQGAAASVEPPVRTGEYLERPPKYALVRTRWGSGYRTEGQSIRCFRQ